nr:MAG TPA: hypothetical protein [Caudoviricetes sp.]
MRLDGTLKFATLLMIRRNNSFVIMTQEQKFGKIGLNRTV